MCHADVSFCSDVCFYLSRPIYKSAVLPLCRPFGYIGTIQVAYIRFVETYAISIPPLRLILLILGQVPRVWEHGHLAGVGVGS